MNTFISYDVGTVEKSTGHSYIFFIADEVIGIPPFLFPFGPAESRAFSVYDTGAKSHKLIVLALEVVTLRPAKT